MSGEEEETKDFHIWLCVPQGNGARILELPETEEHTMDLVEIFDALARK